MCQDALYQQPKPSKNKTWLNPGVALKRARCLLSSQNLLEFVANSAHRHIKPRSILLSAQSPWRDVRKSLPPQYQDQEYWSDTLFVDQTAAVLAHQRLNPHKAPRRCPWRPAPTNALTHGVTNLQSSQVPDR